MDDTAPDIASRICGGTAPKLEFQDESFELYDMQSSGMDMTAKTKDMEAAALSGKAMLGPNAEFADVIISARIEGRPARIHANLTGTVQKTDHIELRLKIIDQSDAS